MITISAPSRSGAADATEPVRETQGIRQAPQLKLPPNYERLATLGGVPLEWENPEATTQYHLQLIPFGQDGPGLDLIRAAENSFTVEGPALGRGPYILLPDMDYTWRVRASDATKPVAPDDPSWGPWSARQFRTPRPDASRIRAEEPCHGCRATSLTPTLVWANDDPFIFYYELQVSRDPLFNSDPLSARFPVFYNLVHAGQALPLSSWAVPESYPLEPGPRYYWRVRPRVQGDGTPVNWPNSFHFDTPAPQPVDLTVSEVLLSKVQARSGDTIVIEYTIRNQGTSSAPPTQSRVLLCPTPVVTRVCNDLGAADSVPALGPGDSRVRSVQVAISTRVIPGEYYLAVYADFPDTVTESSETNNGAGSALTITSTSTPPGGQGVTPSPTVTMTPSPSPTATPTIPNDPRSLIRCTPGVSSISTCFANGEYGDGGDDAAWRGADGDFATRWSSLERQFSFWRANFSYSVTVAQVSIWGRGGGDALEGRLEFSDGSIVPFGRLNPDGCRTTVSFSPRTTKVVKFEVTALGNRATTGFVEIEAYSWHLYPPGDDCSPSNRTPLPPVG